MSTKRPRILFDANPLLGQKTGVGYYTSGIISALAALHPTDIELVGYYCSINKAKNLSELPGAPNIRYRRIPVSMRVINILRRFGILLPIEPLAGMRPDFIFYPNFLGMRTLFATPSATVIHDLTFVDLPNYLARRNLHDLTKFIPPQIKRSTFLVTVSEFGKRRIHDTFCVPMDKILTTPIPPEPPLQQSEAKERELLRKLGISGKFILTLGTIEPRKNIPNMVDAYLQLPPELQQQYTFVIAGKIGWNCEREVALLDQMKSQGKNILHVGYVTEQERAALYHDATLFTWASHYEGFGMPILEAMSYGTPCAISDIPVFKEVAGDAALYFNQNEPKQIADGWHKLLTNTKLRAHLGTAGKKRADSYQWSKVAASLYNRIHTVLEGGKS